MSIASTLPCLRDSIDVSVYHDDEPYVILSDTSGVADGPIMLHAEMISLLELCDGVTSWNDLAHQMGCATDGPEMLNVRAFLTQMEELGFMDSPQARAREAAMTEAWQQSSTRAAACSGSTYPDDADELRSFLASMDNAELASPLAHPVQAVLMPHIDFRVAPQVYGPAMAALRQSDADLFVIVGTSHYWAGDRLIGTTKDFETPLGIVQTDRDLAPAVVTTLAPTDTDLAHRPEHSIELHAVILQYLHGHRPFTILPILVTGMGGADDPEGRLETTRLATELAQLVAASGKKAMYLISGDLAHVGLKFGDPCAADLLLQEVQTADRSLLEALEQGAVDAYHELIDASGHQYRICGHAPTVMALDALLAHSQGSQIRGTVLAYDTWNEAQTQSAVTFATMAFGR